MSIRRTPADFEVRERLTASVVLRAAAGMGSHAVYQLTKTSLTTPQALEMLARTLGKRGTDAGYAGLKDKHAVTTQHVSVPWAGAKQPPPQAGGPNWDARFAGWSAGPIDASCIDGNSFRLVVRDLSRADCDEMDRRAALLSDPRPVDPGEPARGLAIVNYFGDQRFGSARHGKGFVAQAIIRGDFETALRLAIATPARKDTGKTRMFTRLAASEWGKWKTLADRLPRCPERRAIERLAADGDFRAAFAVLPYFLQSLYLEAYQSHLWNATARRLAEQIGGRAVLRTDDDFGMMLFPPAASIGAQWRTLVVPLLARRTELADPWGTAATAALTEEGITPDDLRVPGLKRPFFGEAPRTLFVAAERLELGASQRDELSGERRLKRSVSFDLPRGAYATVVLRALGQ